MLYVSILLFAVTVAFAYYTGRQHRKPVTTDLVTKYSIRRWIMAPLLEHLTMSGWVDESPLDNNPQVMFMINGKNFWFCADPSKFDGFMVGKPGAYERVNVMQFLRAVDEASEAAEVEAKSLLSKIVVEHKGEK